MKQFFVLFAVTFILALATTAALMYLKPNGIHNLFSTSTDSLSIVDTAVAQSDTTIIKKDANKNLLESSTVRWEDTVAVLKAQLLTKEKLISDLNKKIQQQVQSSDSLNALKEAQFAKLMEAMEPEDAARVLENMKDSEIKKILLKIKVKQASKILGSLEPKRAARIMN